MLRIARRWRRGLSREHLRTLGLEPGGDYGAAELKKRFVELAKLHHPDVSAGSRRFLQIKAAYDALVKELERPSGSSASPAAAPSPRPQRTYQRVWRPPPEEESPPRSTLRALPLFEVSCIVLFFFVYAARFREAGGKRRPTELELAVHFHQQAVALELPKISAETCTRHTASYLLSLERRRLAQLPYEVFEQICEQMSEPATA